MTVTASTINVLQLRQTTGGDGYLHTDQAVRLALARLSGGPGEDGRQARMPPSLEAVAGGSAVGGVVEEWAEGLAQAAKKGWRPREQTPRGGTREAGGGQTGANARDRRDYDRDRDRGRDERGGRGGGRDDRGRGDRDRDQGGRSHDMDREKRRTGNPPANVDPGACFAFQSENGCHRLSCRFRHECAMIGCGAKDHGKFGHP